MFRSRSLSLSLAAAGVIVLLAGCASPPPSIVHVPTYPPLMNPQTQLAQQGGIYQPGTALALYESPRARHVGDLLTVKLDESFSAENKAASDGSRTSDMDAKAGTNSTGAAMTVARYLNIGKTNTNFNGKGTVTGSGTLTGTVSVSVISVLPSGNLMVAGDKIIATNNDTQHVRFSGVVNPIDIQAGNVVASTRIANARIERSGDGLLADSTSVGWLQRLFMKGTTY